MDNNPERHESNKQEKQNYDDYKKFYNCPEFFYFTKKADIAEYILDTEIKSIPDVIDII